MQRSAYDGVERGQRLRVWLFSGETPARGDRADRTPRGLKARDQLEQPITDFMRRHEAGSGGTAVKRFLTLHGVD